MRNKNHSVAIKWSFGEDLKCCRNDSEGPRRVLDCRPLWHWGRLIICFFHFFCIPSREVKCGAAIRTENMFRYIFGPISYLSLSFCPFVSFPLTPYKLCLSYHLSVTSKFRCLPSSLICCHRISQFFSRPMPFWLKKKNLVCAGILWYRSLNPAEDTETNREKYIPRSLAPPGR